MHTSVYYLSQKCVFSVFLLRHLPFSVFTKCPSFSPRATSQILDISCVQQETIPNWMPYKHPISLTFELHRMSKPLHCVKTLSKAFCAQFHEFKCIKYLAKPSDSIAVILAFFPQCFPMGKISCWQGINGLMITLTLLILCFIYTLTALGSICLRVYVSTLWMFLYCTQCIYWLTKKTVLNMPWLNAISWQCIWSPQCLVSECNFWECSWKE